MTATRVSPAVAAILGGLLTAAVLTGLTGSPVAGQQPAAETKSEYSVVTVDANALGAKVSELATQGWDVVAVNVLESKVDGGATPPRVITEKYDVTLRRTVKK